MNRVESSASSLMRNCPMTRVTVNQKFLVPPRTMRPKARSRTAQLRSSIDARQHRGLCSSCSQRRIRSEAVSIQRRATANGSSRAADQRDKPIELVRASHRLRESRLVLYGGRQDVSAHLYRVGHGRGKIFRPYRHFTGMYQPHDPRGWAGRKQGSSSRERRLRRRSRRLGCTASLVLLRYWPHASLAGQVPLSTSVWSSGSEGCAYARRSIPAVGTALDIADAHPGIPAERRSLVLLARGVNPVRSCIRIPTYRGGVIIQADLH